MSEAHNMPGRADMSPAIMVIFRMFRALECVDAGLTPPSTAS